MRFGPSWTWALLASSIAACGTSGESPPRGAPTPSASAIAPGCSEDTCAHLGGQCARGVCSELGSSCRLVPVNEGEPCDEAGVCGPGRCEAGVCRPLDSTRCSELDDACSEGYCEPSLGCVARPKALPGASCYRALALDWDAQAPRARLDNTCGAPAPELVARSALGNAAYFLLDLTHAEESVELELLVGATFRVASGLLRGECDERLELARGEAIFGPDAGEVLLEKEVEPGRYWFVVAGVEASDRGAIEVAARVRAGADSNAEGACDEPFALRAEDGLEVRLDPISGPSNYCFDEPPPERLCYRLDLSDRPGDTLVRLELDRGHAFWFSPGDEIERCPGYTDFYALLPPRVHDLYVLPGERRRVALRSSLSDGTECAALARTPCDEVPTLDTTRRTIALRGNTACGARYTVEPIYPKQARQALYRLDLRSFQGPVRLETRTIGSTPSVFVAEPTGDATCGRRISYCISCLLAPREYLLGIENWPNEFEFEVELELLPHEPAPAACITPEVIECAKDSVFECDEQGVNHPRCVGVLEECGLDWGPLESLCASYPECCDEDAAAGAGTDCEQLFLDAGARCPDCLRRRECWF
jgi:hypothetical protein